MSILTAKKKKFLDAYWASCKEPGNLESGNHAAAAKIAGYANDTAGYRLITGEGEVVDPASNTYLSQQHPAWAFGTNHKGVPWTSEPTKAQLDADYQAKEASRPPVEPLEDADIEALRNIRDDDMAPHGARVRATELLMKQRGIDRPTGDEVVENPEEALAALLVMLGVEEVDPVNFTMGQATSWTLPALKSSTPTCEPISTTG